MRGIPSLFVGLSRVLLRVGPGVGLRKHIQRGSHLDPISAGSIPFVLSDPDA